MSDFDSVTILRIDVTIDRGRAPSVWFERFANTLHELDLSYGQCMVRWARTGKSCEVHENYLEWTGERAASDLG